MVSDTKKIDPEYFMLLKYRNKHFKESDINRDLKLYVKLSQNLLKSNDGEILEDLEDLAGIVYFMNKVMHGFVIIEDAKHGREFAEDSARILKKLVTKISLKD